MFLPLSLPLNTQTDAKVIGLSLRESAWKENLSPPQGLKMQPVTRRFIGKLLERHLSGKYCIFALVQDALKWGHHILIPIVYKKPQSELFLAAGHSQRQL